MSYGNGGLALGSSGSAVQQDIAYRAGEYAPQTTAPRLPAVTSQLEQTLKASEVLHVLMDQLEQRLCLVCVPIAPTQQPAGPDKQMLEPVPLAAGALAEVNRRLGGATNRLRYLLDRIDL